MTKPADATGAPLEYLGMKLHPLNMADWGALDRWMQQDIMDNAIDTAKRQQLSGEYLVAMMIGAQTVAARTSTATTSGMAKLNSFEGMLKVIELASRGTMTEEQKAGLISRNQQDLVEEVGAKIIEISQPEEAANLQPPTTGKKAKKKNQ